MNIELEKKKYLGKILQHLYALHAVSLQEGLKLLLRKHHWQIKDIFSQKRSITMVMFAPTIEVNPLQFQQVHNIYDVAAEFCVKQKLDSNFCKIFVRNIGFNVRDRDFWDFFEYFGKVLRATIVRDRKTRRSKGYGFVVFSNPLDAERAINAKKHEITLEGRLLVVKKAERKKGEKGSRNQHEILKEAADYFMQEKEQFFENKGELQKEDQQKCSCYIDKLCDELFFHIFSYLDLKTRIKMELVCRRWQKMSLESWSSVYYLNFKGVFNSANRLSALDDSVLVAILKKGCINLKSIDFSASPYVITKHSFFMIGKMCKQLQHLNLSRTCIQNKTLKYLGENLLQLQTLNMDRCLNVGEKGFWWMFKGLKHLKILSVTESSRLVGKCLYMLQPSLRCVDFSSCSRLNDGGINNLSQSCPNLSSLNLSFCISLTDQSLIYLSQRCRFIEELSLCGLSKTVTHQGFKMLTELKNLVKLDISRNFSVTDEVIEMIGISCTKIQTLNIEACHPQITCAGINALSHYDNLVDLNISYIVDVCDNCILSVSMLNKLRRLLARCCNKLTNNGVAKCFLHLCDLQLFDLSSCFLIDDSLSSFVEIQPRRFQIDVVLGGSQVTENGAAAICKKLSLCKVSLQSFCSGMLRNDRDPTFTAPFFPESDEEDDNDEEEELREIVPFKPTFAFDINSSLPNVNEYGEPLWIIEKSQNEKNLKMSLTGQDTISCDMKNPVKVLVTDQSYKTVSNSCKSENDKPSVSDVEDWDAEIDEHRVWEVQPDTLNSENYFVFDDDEYMLACDDGFDELQG